MIFVGFPIFLAFLSAVPLFGSVCFGRRPERLFAAGLLLNALVYYGFCAVHLSVAGFYPILVANLALYVPALLKLRKEPGRLRDFLTPAVTVCYVSLTAGFLLALRESPIWWDEFSHWSCTAKLLFRFGGLNCEYPRLLEHASYPPGLAVLDTLVHRCFIGVGFRDFMPRFAIRAAKICLFLLPFGDAPKRLSYRECAAGMLFMWLLACFLFDDGNFTCESDCILGAVFAAAVYVTMRHDRSVRDDLFLALLLAWLFLIKKAGMGFAVMTQLLYLVRWIADRRGGDKPKRPVWSLLVVLAAPFVMQLSWSLLLKIHHTPIAFAVDKISWEKVWRLVRDGEPAYWRDVAGTFNSRLIDFLPVFVVIAGGLFVYVKAAGNRPRRSCDLCWFVPAAFAVYLASLFLTYLFIFTRYQSLNLVSFKRYICGFAIMPAGVLLMLAVSGGVRGKWKSALSSNAVIALALATLVRCYVHEECSGAHLARTWPKECAAIDARYGHILRAPGVEFVVVSGIGNGIYHPIFKHEYLFNFADERALKAPEGDQTPQTLKEFIRGRRYVLLMHPPKSMATEYAELWESPLDTTDKYTLFEVTREGRLRPVR